MGGNAYMRDGLDKIQFLAVNVSIYTTNSSSYQAYKINACKAGKAGSYRNEIFINTSGHNIEVKSG